MPVTYFDSGPDAFLKYKKMEKPQVHSIVTCAVKQKHGCLGNLGLWGF